MPIFPYKVRTKDGLRDKNFNLREFMLNECPVSVIAKPGNHPKPDFINGARATEIVRIWHKARRSKSTLAQALGSKAAWVEDVQNTLDDAQSAVDAGYRKASESRINVK